MAKLLVVDDQPSARAFLEVLLAQEGYEVASAENGAQALGLLESGGCDLVLSDLDIGMNQKLSKAKNILP